MSKDHVVLGRSAEELGQGHRRRVDSSDVPRRHWQRELTHGRSSVPDDDGENAILDSAVVVVTMPLPSS
jgi:hypothetical protein